MVLGEIYMQIIKMTKKSLKNMIPTTIILKRRYKICFGEDLNLHHPTNFNEKIQWLKIHKKNNSYTKLVDKYLVRDYVAQTIGSKYLIPLLGVYKTFDAINFDELPDKFVLKTNHDSGSVVICLSKKTFDINHARKVLSESLKRNYFYQSREYPYKKVKPLIIAEQFIGENDCPPKDFKILCFNGKPDNIMVCTDRFIGQTKYYFFDLDWNLLRYNHWGQIASKDFTLPKPSNLYEMISIAMKLSKGTILSRIDLYDVCGKVYFGEITFFPDSGFDKNLTKEASLILGNKIELEK